MGISDADVFSYYLVTSAHDLFGNDQSDAEGLFYPAVDLFALARAGLRSYEGRLEVLAADFREKVRGELDYGQIPSEVHEFRNRLFNWYRLAEYFEAGSLTVTGRDRYRPGDPVCLPWRAGFRTRLFSGFPMRYYCTGCSWQWQLGSPYTTTLQLMRGHNTASVLQATNEIAKAGAFIGVPDMTAET
jgi:hypothetical protein